MSSRVYWARRGAIAELRFDNPKKFNAMTLQMWLDFVAMVKDVAADPEARVLLLRGEGLKAFISGADIAEFDTNRSAATGSAVYDDAVAAAELAAQQPDGAERAEPKRDRGRQRRALPEQAADHSAWSGVLGPPKKLRRLRQVKSKLWPFKERCRIIFACFVFN